MTDEEIKAKYGEVFKIEVPGDKGDAVAYLKKPTRQILSAFVGLISSDPMKANEVLLMSCIIKDVSDMRVVEDDDYFMSAITSLDGLITLKKSTLKKL